MEFGLVNSENWESLNKFAKRFLGISDDAIQVKIFKNMYAAVYELTLGASFFYSFKKSAVFMREGTPVFENILAHFLREMYQIQYLNQEILSNDEKLESWKTQLKKDISFVFLIEDHLITGEKNNLNSLIEWFNERKIFHFVVRNSGVVEDIKNILPFTNYIVLLSSGYALSLSGARIRLHNQISQFLDWDFEKNNLDKIISTSEDNKSDIMSFETQFVDQVYFKNNRDRSYSKAILFFPKINSEYLLSKLLSKLEVSPNERHLYFQSASGCLNPFMNFKKWWVTELTADEISSLFAVRLAAIQKWPLLAKVIKEIIISIEQEQRWN